MNPMTSRLDIDKNNTEEERAFAHGLETGLAVVEESAISSSQQDQHPFFRLHFAALNLSF